MTVERILRQAQAGTLRPVYLIAGEEEYLTRERVQMLRAAALAGGIAGLNEGQFTAGEVEIAHVLAQARTLPMMALLFGDINVPIPRPRTNIRSR